ncbi:hypothetical protein HDV06_002180 [Boothiomyces sp. JEL0866]|nr:hypothetical protein HDV06_002180 [Boothiomyces sp. JEL0866]
MMTSTPATPVRAPQVLYAQDKKNIFLTINLQDVETPDVKLTENNVSFTGSSNGSPYAFNIELFDAVKPETLHKVETSRHIELTFEKANKDAKFWSRLHKGSGKLAFVKTDFSRYQDEDEDEEEKADPMSGMNDQLAQMMGGMGGAGGFNPDMLKMMGGNADAGLTPTDDSDDDDLPDDLPELENAAQ